MTAAFFATRLAKVFSGKGLVPDALISSPNFLVAVMLGAGLTVFLASLTGIPISTTHSLTGALVGVGLVAMGVDLGFHTLGENFFYPLALSPLLSLALAGSMYLVVTKGRKTLGITEETCLCVGQKPVLQGISIADSSALCSTVSHSALAVVVEQESVCSTKAMEIYGGQRFGVSLQKILDTLHFLSAGAVGFARGMNDTPKIVAIALASGTFNLNWITFLAAGVMALGGILQARKVALTMSQDITPMNHGQGLTANLVTSVLVIFASRWGMPVSTTHVSCGSFFGIGLVNGNANWKMICSIVLAWVLTLPLAAGISAFIYFALRG
jgi:PiT family inorganic phosphate transporter